MNRILVIGAGAWGTAIANLLAENTKQNIFLWSFEKKVAQDINSLCINKKYLPNKKISNLVKASTFLPDIYTQIIFIVIPSQFIFMFFKNYKKHFQSYNRGRYYFIIGSKGIDTKRKKLLSDIIKSYFPDSFIAILSGPSFAHDVAERKPTAVTLASKYKKQGEVILKILNNNYFRVYLNNDIIGVQINGTMKNVLAIAAGLTEGLKLGENARAAVIARGIKELIRLNKALGGKKETILGLSGIGDIILTCVSKSSRNYKLGYMIGSGNRLNSIVKKQFQVTEGLENISVIFHFKNKYNIKMPILEAIYKVLVKNHNFDTVVKELLARPPSKE